MSVPDLAARPLLHPCPIQAAPKPQNHKGAASKHLCALAQANLQQHYSHVSDGIPLI